MQSLPSSSECPPACSETCATAPVRIEPIVLADVLARFEREAVRGVCDTGRYRMPYYTWGEGPPLLLIHGVCDSARAFLLPASRLARHFRCIAYDLPDGRGDGARLGRYTHADLVADAWTLLDHLGARQSYVLGSSFGSTIALAALHQRPDRLPRGILQGGLAHRPLRWSERLLARLTRFLPGRLGFLPGRRIVQHILNGAPFAGREPDLWRLYHANTGEHSIASFAYQALMLHTLDLRPILPEIRQPVMLLCGDGDRVVPAPYQDVLMQGLPSGGRVILERCGHVPMYTHPELFAEIVRQFLTPAQERQCAGSPGEGMCTRTGHCERET